MRKVEHDMLAAIGEHRNWKAGNTEVRALNNGLAWVYLHGNFIAEVYGEQVTPIKETFMQWPTRTTVSRLRALGVDAQLRNRKPVIDGEHII